MSEEMLLALCISEVRSSEDLAFHFMGKTNGVSTCLSRKFGEQGSSDGVLGRWTIGRY